MRGLATLFRLVCIWFMLISFPSDARADEARFDRGGLFYIAPAGIGFGISTEKTIAPSYRFGLGGGYLFRRRNFAAEVGGCFEFLPVSNGYRGITEIYRFAGETRLGGLLLTRALYLYARIGVGAAIQHYRTKLALDDKVETDLAFLPGLGLYYMFWKGAFAGFEVDFPLSFNVSKRPGDNFYLMEFSVSMGWAF